MLLDDGALLRRGERLKALGELPARQRLILDEAVNDRLTPSADSLEKLMYGYSLFVCLPDGMSHPGSAGTGTVMRPSVLTDYARQAGFSSVDVVLVEFGFWRLYSLR